MKILMLDDDSFALKLLGIQLKGVGLRSRGFAELIPCEHGHTAVEMVKADPDGIGLIFCDLQMPEMDGVEFVRHLVAIGFRGGLVLISGEDTRVLNAVEQLARAHALNVLGALRKPLFPEQVQQVLDAALSPPADRPHGNQAMYAPEDLSRAIEQGELTNFYQPQVDLASGAVVGMEALVRWRHPRDGLVLPFAFIPMAEASGLITDLCSDVLGRALRDARDWHAAGHPLHVAVNVSMASLLALDFPDCVAREAERTGVPLDKLVLEITETKLMEDPTSQLDVLTRLRLKQVGLSIDDFGTGYSCLAQLRDLPFAELKIDRGFVHGVSRNAALQAILGTSLDLARQLGMKTVAEGVEHAADWEFLRESGCQLAQGYLIARPMPAEQVGPWLADWPARRDELPG